MTDDDLAAVEDVFFREAGLEGAEGQRLLAARGAAAAAAARQQQQHSNSSEGDGGPVTGGNRAEDAAG